MGATGIATDAMKNIVANAYASSAAYLGLLKALNLQASTSAGATQFNVSLSVAAGDVIVFEQGTSAQEQVTVSSVSGLTVTAFSNAAGGASLLNPHATNAKLAHVPCTSSTVHEVASSRVAASWGSPLPAGVIATASNSITVPAGNVIGSLALFSAATNGTYFDATPVTAADFTGQGGSYSPVWVETSS